MGCEQAAGFYLHIAEGAREVGEATDVLWDAYTNTLAHTYLLHTHTHTRVNIHAIYGVCVHVLSKTGILLFSPTGNFPLLLPAFACVLISSSSSTLSRPSLHLSLLSLFSLSLIDLLPKGCSGLRDRSAQCYADMALRTHTTRGHGHTAVLAHAYLPPHTPQHSYHA